MLQSLQTVYHKKIVFECKYQTKTFLYESTEFQRIISGFWLLSSIYDKIAKKIFYTKSHQNRISFLCEDLKS